MIMQFLTGPPDPSSSPLSTQRLSIPAWREQSSPSLLPRLLPARSWFSDPAPPDPGRPSGVFTAITMLNNNLTTFENGYAPGNYHNDTRYTGDITARTALQFSQNNATVSLAQMVGYNNVAALARDAGIKSARGYALGGPGRIWRHSSRYGRAPTPPSPTVE